jgi:hypothetical protein
MKTSYLFARISLLLIFAIGLNFQVVAGPLDSLELKGMIFNNNSRVKDVVVNIYNHNKLFKEIHVKSSNRFVTNLPVNTIVTIEITAPNFHAKRFVIDTKVPGKITKSQLMYSFDIDIFKEDELKNINTSFLDFPVGLVSFDKKKRKFIRNKQYTKRMKKAYLKLWAESQEAERQGKGLE